MSGLYGLDSLFFVDSSYGPGPSNYSSLDEPLSFFSAPNLLVLPILRHELA